MEVGFEPVATGADKAVNAPPVPMVYCVTVVALLFTTYAWVPEGSTAIDIGLMPVKTVAGDIGVSAPVVPMLYCETVVPFRSAT